MIDAQAVVRKFVAGKALVAAVAAARVYAGSDLPAGYVPSEGPAVLMNIRGGVSEYNGMVIEPSVQVRCWGETEGEAWRMYRALYEEVHEKMGPGVKWARCDVLGQQLLDAETGWPMVISFWTFILGN